MGMGVIFNSCFSEHARVQPVSRLSDTLGSDPPRAVGPRAGKCLVLADDCAR
jgi:hypothetical protein